MSNQVCKAVRCLNCIYAIIDPETRETVESAVLLSANNQLTEEQLEDLIEIGEDFQKEVKRRKREDREHRERIKTILELDA